MNISSAIQYVGVNDHDIDLFEGQFPVPHGMAYNSYVILDTKIAVMDSVDKHFGAQWLSNVQNILGERTPDYLIVQHMEMDHSANIKAFMDAYPTATIVSSKMAFTMMQNMFQTDFAGRALVVGQDSVLELGTHTLHFVAAPNVHWPEVIMTYEEAEKVLFSADAFGKFGANDYNDPEGWACEARRYYFGIVGKFGAPVQTLLKKAAALELQTIAPLHGPVLTQELSSYISLYNTWSSYAPETKGIALFYTSVYGNTKEAAQKLCALLKDKGVAKISMHDVAREDVYECIEDAFRYDTSVFATTTYNGGVFPAMREFIEHLTERNFQNRRVAFIENGSWAPCAAKAMKALFEPCKGISYAQNTVSIKIAVKDETVLRLESLAQELLQD